MLETARAIEAGAPPLAELRPDLPKPLLALVDRALSLDPRRRPSALELARGLRGAAVRQRRRNHAGALVHKRGAVGRAAAVGLAAAFAGWSSLALPFFPGGWWLGIAVLAAVATLWRERVGLAVALAVPVLPLGNISLGLALLYGLVACGWLALSWREPRGGLLVALGTLLGSLAALGLLPLATAFTRSPVRRAVQAGAAVLLAALAAGLRHAPLPFTGAPPPLGLGLAGSDGPLDVAGSLARALGAHPAVGLEAAAIAAAAVLLPYARTRGRWGAAGAAGFLLTATLLPVPAAAALPLVLAAWVTWAALTLAQSGMELAQTLGLLRRPRPAR